MYAVAMDKRIAFALLLCALVIGCLSLATGAWMIHLCPPPTWVEWLDALTYVVGWLLAFCGVALELAVAAVCYWLITGTE